MPCKPKFTRRELASEAMLTQVTEFLAKRRQQRCAGRTATRRHMKKRLVSVVDDDQFFRESMRRLMRSLGYVAEAFASGKDFLASPLLTETDCLIADVHMPEMTGIELYRQLADTEHSIPTILVTAFPNDVDRDRAL